MKRNNHLYLLVAIVGIIALTISYILGGIFFNSEDRQVSYDILSGNIMVEQTGPGFYVIQNGHKSKIIRKKLIRIVGNGQETQNNIIISGKGKLDYNIDVILDNVKIRGEADEFCAFNVIGTARITLHHEGENLLKSGKYYAGLQIGESAYLEFAGDQESEKNITILTKEEDWENAKSTENIEESVSDTVYIDKWGFYTGEEYDDREQLEYIKTLKIPELSAGFDQEKKEELLDELRNKVNKELPGDSAGTIGTADRRADNKSDTNEIVIDGAVKSNQDEEADKEEVKTKQGDYIAISGDKLQIVINSLASSLTISLAKEPRKEEKQAEKLLFEKRMELWLSLRGHKNFEEYLVSHQLNSDYEIEEIITRAVLVTVLYELTSDSQTWTAKELDSFKDVEQASWYGKSTAWAKENGIITGETKTLFAPNKAVTREQMAVILTKYLKLMGKVEDTGGEILYLSDVDKIKEWSRASVGVVLKYGIMNADSGNYFNPKRYVTRDEFRDVMIRLSEI